MRWGYYRGRREHECRANSVFNTTRIVDEGENRQGRCDAEPRCFERGRAQGKERRSEENERHTKSRSGTHALFLAKLGWSMRTQELSATQLVRVKPDRRSVWNKGEAPVCGSPAKMLGELWKQAGRLQEAEKEYRAKYRAYPVTSGDVAFPRTMQDLGGQNTCRARDCTQLAGFGRSGMTSLVLELGKESRREYPFF
ncbi:uncharacterized protein SPSK_09821 [Sporothrix schenckii 1099-18]|uniref:Uncharacterized protein n=1 Tax=Sporothrix schenckii 1099-18 TaxID=1397361 RepID=A0A0F2M8T7_SPOSC|nr:uncharacterized protein SPSK_09821 [Sporothrix schenckii 1099-18]KJR85240.1 hypothetical protein SPSK_09821 [Sporothrix schenckii 1099-18]